MCHVQFLPIFSLQRVFTQKAADPPRVQQQITRVTDSTALSARYGCRQGKSRHPARIAPLCDDHDTGGVLAATTAGTIQHETAFRFASGRL